MLKTKKIFTALLLSITAISGSAFGMPVTEKDKTNLKTVLQHLANVVQKVGNPSPEILKYTCGELHQTISKATSQDIEAIKARINTFAGGNKIKILSINWLQDVGSLGQDDKPLYNSNYTVQAGNFSQSTTSSVQKDENTEWKICSIQQG